MAVGGDRLLLDSFPASVQHHVLSIIPTLASSAEALCKPPHINLLAGSHCKPTLCRSLPSLEVTRLNFHHQSVRIVHICEFYVIGCVLTLRSLVHSVRSRMPLGHLYNSWSHYYGLQCWARNRAVCVVGKHSATETSPCPSPFIVHLISRLLHTLWHQGTWGLN